VIFTKNIRKKEIYITFENKKYLKKSIFGTIGRMRFIKKSNYVEFCQFYF